MRNISATLTPIIASASAIPRMLYHMEMQDKATGATNHLYLTNHEANLTFNSITYQSYKVKHSSIKTYLKNQTDNCNVTIDNVDRGMSSYFAYNEFAGQNATIWKIFLDPTTLAPLGTYAAGDYIIQIQGMMDRPKVNEDRCEVRIVNIFNREQSYTPWRRFSAKCNWDFCGTECGYNGGNGKVRGTATSGSTTTLTDTGLGTFATDYWKGASLKILSGTNRGEVRYISGYNATTKTFSIEPTAAFPSAIDTTSKYVVECDKSKSTCKGFNNQANFGGFDEQLHYFKKYRVAEYNVNQVWGLSAVDAFISLIYGSQAVPGVLLDEDIYYDVYNTTAIIGDRIYALCEGGISSIDACQVNGIPVTTFTSYLGDTSQSFIFHGEQKNYKKTAVVQIALSFWASPGWLLQLNNATEATFTNSILTSDPRQDAVVFTVKGLKVQKYNSNGTTNGSPVWSQNPVWCLIDFLLNRASKKLLPAYINFAYAKAAADLCDTLGYKINLVIKEQKKDPEIIELMLNACRGYITYSTGTMEINLERAWVHPVLLNSTPAHYFDDATSGKTQDNIGEGSFDYFQEDVNDTPNKIVVKYVDQEIRENMALVSSSLLAGVPRTSVPYSDINGVFATGLMYIGEQSFWVLAVGSTSLTTLSWTPSKTYPKGYAIFQGAQTFPELTAIYHDYDNQDRVKRVIEKEIDGSAIPTYKQAYNIAEYLGRKSVEGNMKCSFRGHMDSLGLTVGDVVKLTHALPGWVDEEFRVTEASESEDEEVDYTLELYDESFYAESDLLPGVSLGTTLPNPYAVPGHVTNLSLSEDSYTNTTGAYIPTLTLTYTLPSGDSSIFWDYAKVQISTDGGATYPIELTDTMRGAGFKIDGTTGHFETGDTVTVRVISVSSNKISADASTAPTVSNKIDGLVSAPSAIRGLSIEGNPDPNNTQWDGLRFGLTWWKASQTGGAGGEDGLGAGGFTDPYWNGDEYELWVGGTCIDSGMTKEARYDYVYGDGYLDYLDDTIAAANGTVTFKVRRVSLNQPSEWSTITITQAAPANPAGLTGTGMSRSVLFTWDMSAEADLDHYSIRTKIGSGGTWSGWSSISGNSYLRTFTQAELTGGSLAVYIEVKAVDLYGNMSGAASTNAATWMIVPDELYTTLRTDFWVRDSIFNFGDSATAPSEPSKTTLYWTVGSITRAAETFTLAASNLASANNKYVIATLSGGVATLSLADMTAGIPTLNANQIIIATTSYAPNTAGNYLCYMRQANSMMIEGAIIRDATIGNAKIVDLNADKLTAGKIVSQTDPINNYWDLTTGVIKLTGQITITGGSGYANLSDKPTSLSGVNSTEGTKLSGIALGATKNLFFYQASTPTGETTGDLWYKSTTGELYNWSGVAWDRVSDVTQTVLDAGASILYAKVNGSTLIQGGYIRTDFLTADNIQAGTMTGRTLQTASSGKRFVISSSDNEARFYNSSGVEMIHLGEASSDGWGLASHGFFNASGTETAIMALSSGAYGRAIQARKGDGGIAVDFLANSATGGAYGGVSLYCRTTGRVSYPSGAFSYAETPLRLEPGPSAGAPTHAAAKGSLWVDSGGVLYINTSDSTTWAKVGAQ